MPLSRRAAEKTVRWSSRCPIVPKQSSQGKQRPFTGAEYLESLRDGREVYIYGERVKDVTTHPAFRNAAASIALLYDALHDEKSKKVLTVADRHRLRRLHHEILQGGALVAKKWWRSATPSPPGRASAMGGSAAAPITRRRSSTRSAPMPTSTASSPTTRAPGTSAPRRRCSISITRWSIRPSTATSRPSRSRTSTSRFRKRPTPASTSPAPRWSPPTRRSPITIFSARTWARRSTIPPWW